MRKIVKLLIPKKLFDIIEPYGHLVEAMLANLRYGFPARGLNVIGVTGTDGKTTTSTLITTMLRKAGYKVGMLTTISFDYGDGPVPNPTRMTVMKSGQMLSEIKKMNQKGIEWLVLETTSHALAQNRVWGVPYSVAVMTNVAHEHLDYHRSFENYLRAKLKLFKLVGRNQKGLQIGVVNADDPAQELFAGEVPRPVRYGIEKGEVKAFDISSSTHGNSFLVRRGTDTLHITSHLPSRFNIYNTLAAVSVGIGLDLTNQQIENGIESLESVEGRMNPIVMGQDFSVIVDYAHTPDSFEGLFKEMRPVTRGRLIVMFGSAGERDHEKRGLQGEIAGRLCDVVVVTEEDDRSEDGEAILREIAAGAEKAGKKRDHDLFLIHDRTQAIAHAIGLAKKDDTVMLLGKGHEKSILTSKGKKPWDEVAAVKKALKK